MSSEPRLLVLGLPERTPDGPLDVAVWFERMLDPGEQAAIGATVPLPFDEVSWAGGNLLRLGTSRSQGERPVSDWPAVRQALLCFLEDLHAREAIAFAQGPDTFSLLEGAAELAERVIPPVLAYFEATPAIRSPENDPGVSLVEGCLRQIRDQLDAGRTTLHEDAWRTLLNPALGRSFHLDSGVLAELSPISDHAAASVDPRLALASFRKWPAGVDALVPMRAVLDARSVSPGWFGAFLQGLRSEAESRAVRAIAHGAPILPVDVVSATDAFDVVRRYREFGEPFDRSWLRAARDLARRTDSWADEIEITRDLLGVEVGFEAQRVRGHLLEEALRRADQGVIAEQLAHVREKAQAIASGAPEAEALEAQLVTPALRELVRANARASAAELAAAYVAKPGKVLETDETLSLVLRALSFDPERRAVEDAVADDVAKRVAYHTRLRTEPPKQPPLFGPEAIQTLMKMYLAQAAPKVSNLLPLALAAWHARRGRHEEAAALAATSLEWGNDGARTDPDLAVARTLEPLLGALRTAG